MTSGRPGPSGDEAWRPSRVDNDMSGDVHGTVFQAGYVDGGIHNHIHYHGPAPLPPDYQPPFSPAPSRQPPPSGPPSMSLPPMTAPAVSAAIPFAVPTRPRRGWLRRSGRWCGEWLVSFAPLVALSLVPGGVALGIIGDGSVGARLASLVIGLAVVGVAGLVWWLVTRRRSQLSVVLFALSALDRLAFRRLGTAGVPALICIAALCVAEMIYGVAQQPQPSADGAPSGTPFMLVFFTLGALVAARRLLRRD